jgi:hypothetical protein
MQCSCSCCGEMDKNVEAAVKEKPKILRRKADRQRARADRDRQWGFMEQVARCGTVWFCPWDKARRHDMKNLPPDVYVSDLFDPLRDWMGRHTDWWIVGEWSEEKYARAVQLTHAGRAALANREKYDMEPVYGGLVEPGWKCVPLPKEVRKEGVDLL